MKKIKKRYRSARHPWLKVVGDTAIAAIPVLEWFISNPEWEPYKRGIQLLLLVLKLFDAWMNRNRRNNSNQQTPHADNANYSAILLLFLLPFTSCKVTEQTCREKFPCPEITSTIEKHDTIERIRDSVVTIPPDSAWLRAYIRCDSLNNIVISELETSKNSKPRMNFKFTNGQLSVSCKIDSQQVFLRWKETHIKAEKIEIKTLIKEVNFLTGFQNFQIWCGRIFMLCLLLVILFLIYRFK